MTRPSHYSHVRSVVESWGQLIPGDNVLLLGPKPGQRHAGTVDIISPDQSILWLVLENGGGRKLFHQSDVFQTLVAPDRF